MAYENFNVEPGMSAWVDMPDEYKIAWKKWKAASQGKKITEQNMVKMPEPQITPPAPESVEKEAKKVKKKKLKKRGPLGGYDDKMTKTAAVCNYTDTRFFEERYKQITNGMIINKNRKRIMLVSDVCGWAWWNKSQYLKAYLADEFDINPIYIIGDGAARSIPKNKYDLYVTYGYSYVPYVAQTDRSKVVTGITAHRALHLLKPYMNMAGHVHANSRMLEADLRKMVKHESVYYVPNGVDEELFYERQPMRKEGTLIAGHVGKQCKEKGQLEIILPAMAEADVESAYNMNDYRSRVPYCEMYKFYQGIDVFVVASVEDGTPNGALEAAACGRPILSNRIGNMPEFIKDGYNGFLVDRKVGAYVERLKWMQKHREETIEMGKNARKTVEERWTWSKQSDNWRKMFRNIFRLNVRRPNKRPKPTSQK